MEEPTAVGDAICLIVEFAGVKLIEKLELFFREQL